ncbi:MAG TPA: PIN domain-containing protein [Chitinophagales bacterium]|nr:PIN domain-containing protein [Chitinophagales bacterium]
MSIINKIFIDSSVLIEYFKGSKLELLEQLALIPNLKLQINETVISEVIYHIIGFYSNISPVTLKRKGKISELLSSIDLNGFLQNFDIIYSNIDIDHLIQLMANGNYLPNDALILNCCLENNIQYLATYDSDFNNQFIQSKLQIISSIEDMKLIT